jgi:integrase
MALTDTFIRQGKWSGAKAGDKYSDGGGLCILIKSAGKYWRLNYRFLDKQKTLALGVYPALSLAAARKARDRARELLAAGTDPGAEKQEARAQAKRAAAAVFEGLAREWLETSASTRGEVTQKRVVSWFERDVFPIIGDVPIKKLRPPDILELMQRMQARGIIDSMRRVLGYLSKVFELAMVKELIDRDPTIGVAAQLQQYNEGHFAAITQPVEVGALLRAIHAYQGHPYCRAALKLAPLVFVRPHMLRYAEWSEIDLEAAEWRVPAEKMKMEIDHIVPLARQAVAILRDMQAKTGSGQYVFPSIRGDGRPMSENTINAALRSMGYDGDTMTGHGFRAMARTLLDEELGERVDFIEHQLAHAVKDANGRAYNRTTHLAGRQEMMQRWADYLDKLRLGGEVVPLRSA